MSFNGVTWLINALIIASLSIGFIWGLKRGAFKSFVRLSFLIFNCVFWLLITPGISQFILNIDLYPLLNVNINGEYFTTLHSAVTAFIETNEVIVSLVESSSIIASFISYIPSIVANFVVFILGYFLLKSITFPIYAYITNKLITAHYKKTNKKPVKTWKSRLVGGLLGALQSGLTAMVLFMPISVLSIALQGSPENTSMLSFTNLAITETIETPEQNSVPTQTFDSSQMEEFLNLYNTTVLSNTLNVMNLNGLNEFIFNQLSTVEINGVKISLSEELKNTSDALKITKEILAENKIYDFNNLTEENAIYLLENMDYDKAQEALDILLNLKSLNVAGDDILEYAYENFQINNKNLEEIVDSLPENLSPIVENLILSLKSGDIKLLKEDISSSFNVLKTLHDNNVFGFTKNKSLVTRLINALDSGDETALSEATKEILIYQINNLSDYSKQDIETKLISKLFESSTIRRLNTDLINMYINLLNTSLNIKIEPVTRVSVSWSNEVSKLSTLLYYTKENAEATISLLEQNDFEHLKQVNLTNIGYILNGLRDSQVFSYIYEQTLNELFHEFLKVDVIDNTLNLEYLSVYETDWVKEFESLNDVLDIYSNLNPNINSLTELNMTDAENLLDAVFNSNLVKELLFQSKDNLPSLLDTYFDTQALTEQELGILNNFKATLQEMSLEEIKNDFEILTGAFNVILLAEGDSLEAKIISLNQTDIESVLTEFNNTKLGVSLLPQIINIALTKLNEEFDLEIKYLNNQIKLTTSQIQTVSDIVYNLKEVYPQLLAAKPLLEKLNLDEYDSNQQKILLDLINTIDFEKLGEAIDKIQLVYSFKGMYQSLLNETLFNENFYKTALNINFIKEISLTSNEVNNISWSYEFEMLKTAVTYASNILLVKTADYNTQSIKSLFTDYSNSALLNIAYVNGLTYLFPEANINIIKNLDIKQSAVILDGLVEAALSFIHFQHNGTFTLKSMQKYRIREAFMAIDSTPSLKALLEEITGINNISYDEIVPLTETYFNMLQGYTFSINELAPYLNAAPLIPWLVDFIEQFSQGSKLPFYLNIYIKTALGKVKLYGIHLGKQTATNDTGETFTITTEEVVEIMKTLSIVPDFITAQFIYDSNFIQPTANTNN